MQTKACPFLNHDANQGAIEQKNGKIPIFAVVVVLDPPLN